MCDKPRLIQKLSLREKRCHQQEQSTLSTDPESLVQAGGGPARYTFSICP